MVFDSTLLNTQHYKVTIKGMWNNPGKGVASSPTPRCRSYWKESLRVTLDYSRQLHFFTNKYLGILEADAITQAKMKKKKRIYQKGSQEQALLSSRKILDTFL